MPDCSGPGNGSPMEGVDYEVRLKPDTTDVTTVRLKADTTDVSERTIRVSVVSGFSRTLDFR